MSKDVTNEELLASADPMMDKIRINVYTEGTMKVKSTLNVTQHNPLAHGSSDVMCSYTAIISGENHS